MSLFQPLFTFFEVCHSIVTTSLFVHLLVTLDALGSATNMDVEDVECGQGE